MTRSALEGIKVVEFAHSVSGAYCGKLLADLGADVIKIEPPEGDPTRWYGPFPKNEQDPEKSALFLYLNTSKRGMVLDLKNTGNRDTFKDLIQWADVFIDDHFASVLENIDLGWPDISINAIPVHHTLWAHRTSGRIGICTSGPV